MESEQIWTNRINLPNDVGSVSVPTDSYNVFYQLAHMQGHFFDEGIGLKQMTDYFWLLKLDGKRNIDNVKKIKYLGLWNFAGAVMCVMREVFDLDVKFMIALVDEQRRKTLMKEVLNGGNFGKYSGLAKHSMGGKYVAKTLRNFCFVCEYPAKTLCEPLFRTLHFLGRLCNK